MIGGINMVVAFTGYRPEKMPFVESKKDEAYLKFRKRQLQVIERLIERGCTHFISGVAMGFDTWVAEDILVLQKNNSSLELECAIPFPGQADRWSTSDQKRRYKILTHATSSVIVCEHYSSKLVTTSLPSTYSPCISMISVEVSATLITLKVVVTLLFPVLVSLA